MLLTMGLPPIRKLIPYGYLNEQEVIQFGNTSLKVLFLPGHAPGHVGFYHAESLSLLSGDVLFQQSIGRTDLRVAISIH
ncbi:MAG: hypothetical protein U5K54_27550 [Cytophagales bacterium]|nr:hypothetical protein [Cytophagales bacterium]